MYKITIILIISSLLFAVLGLFANRSNSVSKNGGLINTQLVGCPDSRNCVSTSATQKYLVIEPIGFISGTKKAEVVDIVKTVLEEYPRTIVNKVDGGYIWATAKTKIGFLDDIEMYVDMSDSKIYFRSISRVGYYDLGKNRDRFLQLRALLYKYPQIMSV